VRFSITNQDENQDIMMPLSHKKNALVDGFHHQGDTVSSFLVIYSPDVISGSLLSFRLMAAPISTT
jgi:hypothetical protein